MSTQKQRMIIMPNSSDVYMPSVLLSSMLGFLTLSSIEALVPYKYSSCSNTTTFTPNSTYHSNLNILLSYLTSNSTNGLGFHNTTVGDHDPTTAVYGSFFCRGDATPEMCQECVSTITRVGVQKYCPLRKISIIWYDFCMLRYSNTSFFGNLEESPEFVSYDTRNITEPGRFMELLVQTMNSMVVPVANAPSGTKKFATKEFYIPDWQIHYTLVQCTPDISSQSCVRCLRRAISVLPVYNGSRGGNILFPSCELGHNVFEFYTDTDAAPTAAPSPSSLLRPPPPPGSVARPDQYLIRLIVNSRTSLCNMFYVT